jgi:hypothetical protein
MNFGSLMAESEKGTELWDLSYKLITSETKENFIMHDNSIFSHLFYVHSTDSCISSDIMPHCRLTFVFKELEANPSL